MNNLQKGRVSVIVPVYQTEKYIEKCIKSICGQNYEDIEIVLVDDGSTDKSISIAVDIIKSYGIEYKLIQCENVGPSCRNRGISKAAGEYIIAIDSDDIIAPDFLQEMVRVFIENPSVDVVIHNYQSVKENEVPCFDADNSTVTVFTSQEMQNIFLYRSKKIIVPAMMLRHSFLRDNLIGYDEEMRYSEDLQYIWQTFFKAKSIAYIEEARYCYVHHGNSIMTGSNISKIRTGFDGMLRFTSNIEDNVMRNQIMARWVLGVMHSGARILDRKGYYELLDYMNYKMWITKLKKFADIRVRIMAQIALCSRFLAYRLFRTV